MGLGLRSTPADSVASGMRQRKGRAVGPTASIWVVLDEVLPSLGFICKNDMKIIVPRSQGQRQCHVDTHTAVDPATEPGTDPRLSKHVHFSSLGDRQASLTTWRRVCWRRRVGKANVGHSLCRPGCLPTPALSASPGSTSQSHSWTDPLRPDPISWNSEVVRLRFERGRDVPGAAVTGCPTEAGTSQAWPFFTSGPSEVGTMMASCGGRGQGSLSCWEGSAQGNSCTSAYPVTLWTLLCLAASRVSSGPRRHPDSSTAAE